MSRKTLYRLLGFLSLAGYGWLALNSFFSHSPVQGVCIFKAVTKLPCPSCGTTRAVMLLLHGKIAEYLLLNPLGVILFSALVVIPFWILADVFMKRESLHRRYMEAERMLQQNAWISIPLIALAVANWIWNIAKRL